MPIIACLGWGSLIREPKDLPVELPWKQDGPTIHVDFLRKSKDGRITLVLDKTGSSVPALWNTMTVSDVASAVTALREREDIPPEYESKNIGVWRKGDDLPELIENLPLWAQAQKIDAVIWTALRHKFHGPSGEAPTSKEIVDYLREREGEQRKKAEDYVRHVPPQIDTAIRRDIERALGWTPLTPST